MVVLVDFLIGGCGEEVLDVADGDGLDVGVGSEVLEVFDVGGSDVDEGGLLNEAASL